MLVFYGVHQALIKKYLDNSVQCEVCGKANQQFKIYQDYAHVFLIPMFPTTKRLVRCECLSCGDKLNTQKRDYYSKQPRTPIYLFSLAILFVLLVCVGIGISIRNQQLRVAYVNEPAIGDVYLIKQQEDSRDIYYFMKINAINGDSISLYSSYFQYNQFPDHDRMDENDYFNTAFSLHMAKTDAKFLLEKDVILRAKRGYKPESRFNIEKFTRDTTD